MDEFYLLIIWNDVEPQLRGPYQTDLTRLRAARLFRRNEGADHGLFRLNAGKASGVAVHPFSGREMDE